MTRTIIKNATVVTGDGLDKGRTLYVDAGRFVASAPDDSDAHVIDAENNYVAPGFIDLHIHGTGSHLIDNGPAELEKLCKLLPRYGVTGFLPSVCPRPKGEDAEFLKSLAGVKSQGTQILGFHLEGPFLSITGALPPEALGAADPERVAGLIEAAKPFPAIFSISPEFKGVCELIELMAKDSAPVFMTHTKANVEQTQAAIKAGACHATHFYDVFYAPEETDGGVRPCGAVEAILADENVSVDFILDGEHVDPVAVRMALQCKGPSGVCLITDAQVGAGMPPGRYNFVSGEVEFKYPGGPARFTENAGYPGGLAGSGLTMDLAVRNAIKLLGVDLAQAVRMASANPAKVLHLQKSKGAISPGFDADFVILDKDLCVKQTWAAGRCVFTKE